MAYFYRHAKIKILLSFVHYILICTTSTRGTPTLNLGSGNTVVPDNGIQIIGTTTTCFSSTPTFTWELVSEDGRSSLSQLTGSAVSAVSGGSCGSGSSLYGGSVYLSYNRVNPAVFGQTVRIRLTINNNPGISTTSTGTLSLIVHYNLTESSQAATLEQEFTWTCHMVLDAGQNIHVVKFYRDETEVGIIGNFSGGCRITVTDPRYSFGCISLTKYTLTIPSQNMTDYEQNTLWRCGYFDRQSAYSSVQKRLTIAIDVSRVTLEPRDNPLTLTEGTQREVKCTVNSNSFPTPTYAWFIDTRDITSTAGSDPTSIIITGSRSDNGKVLRCQATNNNKPKSGSTVLSITYKPTISVTPPSPYQIREGDTAMMSCAVTDANPNTGITWSWTKTGNSGILYTGQTYTITNIHKGQSGTYQCTATNSIGTSDPATVQVDVQYKPTISVTPSSPYQIREGDTAVMSCAVTDANPNTGISYRWTKTGHSGAPHTGQTYTITNIQRGQRGTYQCTATNSIGTSDPATVQVDVQYKPSISISPLSPYREGDTAVMSCVVTDANPNTGITWRWTKTEDPSVQHTGQNYTITNIQRGQRGTYQCTATNSIGTSDPATVTVDVQYKPSISVTPPSPYQIREGATAVMSCAVTDANPNTGISYRWTKTGNSGAPHTGQTYTITNIQRGQRGTYQCTATNSIGTSDPATVQVDVQYGPSLINLSPELSIINKTENETVGPVDCSAVCNPTCTYRWTGNSGNSGRLELGELKRTERGNYTCTASNTINSSTRTITVFVNYPPKIADFQASGDQTYEEFSSFSITCNVDSYPYSDISINNVETGETITSGGPRESLIFQETSAKCYQTANYICHSTNSYGSTSSRTQRIQVNCSPRPFDGRSSIDIGIKAGEGLNISTQFIGYPLPTFSWSFKKNVTDNPTSVSGQHQLHSTAVNVSIIRAGITKETLSQEEFGFYTVTATTPGKQYQAYTVTFRVIPERRPDPPYNITVDCKISRGTALVRWTPNFDGGATQTFNVLYRGDDGFQKNATKTLLTNATITGLRDGSMYSFKVIASNTNGATFSEEQSCLTKAYPAVKQPDAQSKSSTGGIIGGTSGAIFLVIVVFLIIWINRKYEIKCTERYPIPTSASRTNEEGLDENVGSSGQQTVASSQYEELSGVGRDQENSYEAIGSQGVSDDHRKASATYESLQSRNDENKYELLPDQKAYHRKDETSYHTNVSLPADVYINTSFQS